MKGGFVYKVIVRRNNGIISNFEVKRESLFWRIYTWFTNRDYKVEVYQNDELILGR